MAATVTFSDRSHGDLAAGSLGVQDRRRTVVDRPWSWLQQVHGGGVVVARSPGDGAGERADALVTAVPGGVVAVQVADCAPVALVGDGAVGVAHVGWRGLVAGVVPATVAALRELGGGRLRAVVGPCIEAACYEFGSDDLARVAAALGPGVVARTAEGRPALDLPAGVAAALRAAGVDEVEGPTTCTACSPAHWSARRGDVERQAVVAWLS